MKSTSKEIRKPFSKYLVSILSIQVNNFINTGWQFHQYSLTISSIPVIDFVNTCYQFGQYRRRYIFKDPSKFEREMDDSKGVGGVLEIYRYRIKNKMEVQNCSSVPSYQHHNCANSIWLNSFLNQNIYYIENQITIMHV